MKVAKRDEEVPMGRLLAYFSKDHHCMETDG